MRFTRALALLALVAVPASQASAQTLGKYKFLAGSSVSGWGVSVGTYKAQLDGNNIDVWCVDYLNHISVGNHYDVWISGLGTGADVSKTRWGTLLGGDTYRKAAYLSSQFKAGNTADWKYIHAAIWALTTPGTPSILNANDVLTVNSWLNSATTNYKNYYYNNAFVLTDVAVARCAAASPAGAPWTGCGFQEHIFIDGDLTATPEPVTMGLMAVGLVGIGGAGLARRRKNNK
ncbi:MAG: PEP-CTERM sorting domain-containing protein [Gemmatimonadota bacterium]